jgi:hypothetical protein
MISIAGRRSKLLFKSLTLSSYIGCKLNVNIAVSELKDFPYSDNNGILIEGHDPLIN